MIDVVSGEITALPVPATSVDITVLNGSGYVCGWSFRDASGDVASVAAGSVVAPGAGVIIATSPATPAGVYTLNWSVDLNGPAAAGDADNFRLFVNGVSVETSVNAGAQGEYPQVPVQVNIPAGATYQVKAVGAGTAGVTYRADVSAVPVIAGDAVVDILDGSNFVGTMSVGASGASSQNFGQTGIKIRSGITVHVVSGIVAGAVLARFASPSDYP